MKTETIIRGAFFLVLFFIASNIIPQFQILGIPFTFQTLVILLVPFFFNIKDMTIWYISLLLICLVGIPIMSGYSSGLAVLLGPTAGFIYSWLLKILIIKYVIIRTNNRWFVISAMVIGTIVNLLVGGYWLALFTNTSILSNIQIVIVSFLPFGIVKVLLAQLIVEKIPVSLLINKEV